MIIHMIWLHALDGAEPLRTAWTRSALVAPPQKPSPSAGESQPSRPAVSPPHPQQPHTSTLVLASTSGALRTSCLVVHILHHPTRALFDRDSTWEGGGGNKVQVTGEKKNNTNLTSRWSCDSKTVFIHSAARPRDQQVPQEETSQTTTNPRLMRHTRCSCCALLRWFYTTRPPCQRPPPG